MNDAGIGSTIQAPGQRRIKAQVCGTDGLDRVELLKNGRVLRRWWPESASSTVSNKHRLRLTWGWGRKDRPVRWDCRLSLSEGAITLVESCFAGPPVVAPVAQVGDAEVADDEDLPHEVCERTERSCAWRSVTVGNLSMRHATTQALSLELDAPLTAVVSVEANGQRWTYRLADLLHAGRCRYLRGWLSEAIRVGPLVPLGECALAAELADEPEREVDVYRLRVNQHNGQWVWLTPIWAER